MAAVRRISRRPVKKSGTVPLTRAGDGGQPRSPDSPDRKRQHRNDFILTAVLLVLAVAGLVGLYLYRLSDRSAGDFVEIRTDGNLVAVCPLGEDRTLTIPFGDGGSNTVVIASGQVSVTEADCPDRICVAHPPISRDGETIVCLPHRLTVRVVREEGKRRPDEHTADRETSRTE